MFLLDKTTIAEFYSHGFFGYGEVGDFKYGSFAHIFPILLLIAAIVLTYIFREKIKVFKHEKSIRYILAFLLIISEMGYYWRVCYAGNQDLEPNLLTKLPIVVCTWTSIFGAFMLMSENDSLFDYVAYVSLTLGLLPLATPAVLVKTGPRYFRYYQYWIEHLIPVYGSLYMIFIKGKKIKLKSIWKPFVILGPGMALAIYFNSKIEGADFFFLANNTEGSSLASILPNNMALKVIIYTATGITLFLLEYLVYYLIIHFVTKYREKKNNNEIKEEYFVKEEVKETSTI